MLVNTKDAGKIWPIVVKNSFVKPSADSIILTASAEATLVTPAEVIDGITLNRHWQDIVTSTHPDYGDVDKSVSPSIFLPLDLEHFLAVRVRAVSAMEKWGPNCVPAGTPILMADGSEKMVENIVVGDIVVSHVLKHRKVTKLFSYDNYRELLGIRARGWSEPLWLTPDQKIWALKADEFVVLKREMIYNQTCPTNDRKRNFVPPISLNVARDNLGQNINMRWIPANELRRNDIIAMPFENKIENTDEIASPEMAQLLGYYLSEGCRGGNAVVFVTHVKETQLRAKLDHVAMIFDQPISHRSMRNSINVVRTTINTGRPSGKNYNGKVTNLIDICEKHCGKISKHKALSAAVMKMPHEWQKEFLLAYFDGDGSQRGEDGTRFAGTMRIVTASQKLAQQIQEMLWRFKIHASISARMNPGKMKNAGMIYEISIGSMQAKQFLGESAHHRFSATTQDREDHCHAIIGDGVTYLPISQIFHKEYNGTVYDFEVEQDLSYVAGRMIVYDCNGDAFPANELEASHLSLIAKGFYDEHNSFDPINAMGIIAHAQWFPEQQYVECVALIDKVLFPEEADMVRHAFRTSKKAGVSIGCIAGSAECSICGNIARKRGEICAHMDRSNSNCIKGRSLPDRRFAYDICRDLRFYELSYTKAPADRDALPTIVQGADLAEPKDKGAAIEKDVEKQPDTTSLGADIKMPDEVMVNKLVDRAVNQAIKSRVNKLVKAEVDRVLGPYFRELQVQVKPDIKDKVEDKKEEVRDVADIKQV